MIDRSHLKLTALWESERRFCFPGGTPDGSNEHWRRVYMDTFMLFILGIDNETIGYCRATAAVEVFQDLAREHYGEGASDSVEMQIDQRMWNKLFSEYHASIFPEPIPPFPWKIPDRRIFSPLCIAYRAWRQVLGLSCKRVWESDPRESELAKRALETYTVEDGREILQAAGHAKYFKGFGGSIRDKKLWHDAWHQGWFKAAMMSSNNRSSSTPQPPKVQNPFSNPLSNPFAPVSSIPPLGEKRKIWPNEDESKGGFKMPKTSTSTTKPGFLAPTFNQPDTTSPASYSLPTTAPSVPATNSNSMAKEPGTIQGHQVIGLDESSVSEKPFAGWVFAPPASDVPSVGGLFGSLVSTAASVGAPPTSIVVSEDANPQAPLFEDEAVSRKLPNFNDSPPIHKTLVNCWETLSKSRYWIKSRLVTAAFEIRLPNTSITNQLLQAHPIITIRHSGLFQIERRGVKDEDLCLGINLSRQFTGELSMNQMDILRDTWKCIVRWVTVVCQGSAIEFTKWCFVWSRDLCPLMDNRVSEQQTWVWLERNEKTTSLELVKTLPREADCQFGKEISEKISKIINEHKSSEDNEGLLQAVSSAVLAERAVSDPRSRFLQGLMIAVHAIATSKFETESFSEAHRLFVLIREGHPTLQIT